MSDPSVHRISLTLSICKCVTGDLSSDKSNPYAFSPQIHLASLSLSAGLLEEV